MIFSDGKILKYLGIIVVVLSFSAMILSCGGDKEVRTEEPSGDPEITPVEETTTPPGGGGADDETVPISGGVEDEPISNSGGAGLMVEIPDGNLELIIRESLGGMEGPLTAGDMASVTRIEAPNKGIGSLDGLEYCINLEELFLGASPDAATVPNYISDITPIADLTRIWRLDIQGNRIFDLTPLENLVELKHLIISNNGIEDISALGNLVNLEDLLMIENKIGDISPLAGCTEMVNLWAQHNEIADITALAGLENLSKVNLDGNLIRDLTPLLENPGIGDRDQVFVSLNPLLEDAETTQIELLRARGVFVSFAKSSGG